MESITAKEDQMVKGAIRPEALLPLVNFVVSTSLKESLDKLNLPELQQRDEFRSHLEFLKNLQEFQVCEKITQLLVNVERLQEDLAAKTKNIEHLQSQLALRTNHVEQAQSEFATRATSMENSLEGISSLSKGLKGSQADFRGRVEALEKSQNDLAEKAAALEKSHKDLASKEVALESAQTSLASRVETQAKEIIASNSEAQAADCRKQIKLCNDSIELLRCDNKLMNIDAKDEVAVLRRETLELRKAVADTAAKHEQQFGECTGQIQALGLRVNHIASVQLDSPQDLSKSSSSGGGESRAYFHQLNEIATQHQIMMEQHSKVSGKYEQISRNQKEIKGTQEKILLEQREIRVQLANANTNIPAQVRETISMLGIQQKYERLSAEQSSLRDAQNTLLQEQTKVKEQIVNHVSRYVSDSKEHSIQQEKLNKLLDEHSKINKKQGEFLTKLMSLEEAQMKLLTDLKDAKDSQRTLLSQLEQNQKSSSEALQSVTQNFGRLQTDQSVVKKSVEDARFQLRSLQDTQKQLQGEQQALKETQSQMTATQKSFTDKLQDLKDCNSEILPLIHTNQDLIVNEREFIEQLNAIQKKLGEEQDKIKVDLRKSQESQDRALKDLLQQNSERMKLNFRLDKISKEQQELLAQVSKISELQEEVEKIKASVFQNSSPPSGSELVPYIASGTRRGESPDFNMGLVPDETSSAIQAIQFAGTNVEAVDSPEYADDLQEEDDAEYMCAMSVYDDEDIPEDCTTEDDDTDSSMDPVAKRKFARNVYANDSKNGIDIKPITFHHHLANKSDKATPGPSKSAHSAGSKRSRTAIDYDSQLSPVGSDNVEDFLLVDTEQPEPKDQKPSVSLRPRKCKRK